MHGWIHICLEEMVLKKHGKETWEEIISSPDVSIPAGGWEMLEPYSDEVTFGIFGATCSVLKTELNPLLEAFGSFFLSFTAERGYSDMLNCQGATLREWLGNVNDLHENMKNSVASTFVFPLIFTEDDLDGGSESSAFMLHYQSPRGGVLAPVVVGVVTAAADSYFHETVELELQASQGVDGSKFTSWRVLRTAGPVLAGTTGNANYGEMQSLDLSLKKTKDFPARCPISGATIPPSTSVPPRNGLACSDSSLTKSTDSSVPASSSHDGAPAATRNDVGMSVEMLNEVFPFHLKFNRDFVIVSVGPQLQRRVPLLCVGESRVDALFTITRPLCFEWSWADLRRIQSSRVELQINDTLLMTLSGGFYTSKDTGVGSLLLHPVVNSVREMNEFGLNWGSDISKHSSQQKLILTREHLKSEQYWNEKFKDQVVQTEQALDMKRLFVRYVSHEIRTPLNTVSVGLHLMKSLRSSGIGDALNRALERVGGAGEDDQEISTKRDEEINSALEHLESMFDMADDVSESCGIALDILNDLLLYEKIEGGLLSLERSPHAALPLISSVVRMFGVHSRAKDINIALSSDSSCFEDNELEIPTVFIHVDKSKINQVMRNLLSNAIKFSLPGSTIKVHCSLVKLGDAPTKLPVDKSARVSPKQFVRVEFTDSGVGMLQSDIKRLFDNIIQFEANEHQNGGGSGIGLYISKGIMDLHGGFISVSSAGRNRGCTFHIDIPVYVESEGFDPDVLRAGGSQDEGAPLLSDWSQGKRVQRTRPLSPQGAAQRRVRSADSPGAGAEEPAPASHELDTSQEAAVETTEKNLHILVVDDSILSRKMVSRFLGMSGICKNSSQASDGAEALNMVAASLTSSAQVTFDVILIDASMPIMDGPSAVKEIRRLGYGGIIIGLTGHVSEEDTLFFLKSGADHVLNKPVDMDALKTLIRS